MRMRRVSNTKKRRKIKNKTKRRLKKGTRKSRKSLRGGAAKNRIRVELNKPRPIGGEAEFGDLARQLRLQALLVEHDENTRIEKEAAAKAEAENLEAATRKRSTSRRRFPSKPISEARRQKRMRDGLVAPKVK